MQDRLVIRMRPTAAQSDARSAGQRKNSTPRRDVRMYDKGHNVGCTLVTTRVQGVENDLVYR